MVSRRKIEQVLVMRLTIRLIVLSLIALRYCCPGASCELIRDPHFQSGFHLLEPKPGKRVVYGEMAGLVAGEPVLDLAQWLSRFPLQPTNCFSTEQTLVCSDTCMKKTARFKARNTIG